MKAKRVLDVLFLSALAALAVSLVFESGRRGFQAFDQSIVFDGGYRVLLGQRPFRDFFLPTGPVPFWIQAVFFALGGVDYGAYLAHAAVLNAAASLLVYAFLHLALPRESRLFAYLGALLTAFWFYPPFGTPWLEQTGFFFQLAAAVALLLGIRAEKRRWAVAAGVAVVASFLSKQNVGLLSLVACAAMALASERRRALLAGLAAGAASGAGAFGLWLVLRSRPDHFWTFFFRIPAAEGARRFSGSFLSDLFFEELSLRDPVRAVCSLAFLLGLSVLASRRARARYGLAATCLVSLFVVQSVFIHVTNNEPENAFAFCGLIAALGLGMAYGLARSVPAARLTLVASSLLIGISLASYGRSIALTRRVHDVFFRSRFDESVVSEALAPVRWAIPTPVARRRPERVRVEDVDALVHFLRASEGNFFVFPDYTVLYGLTGRTPPQPLLWLHKGLTYDDERTPWLDARIVSDFERNDVTHVVLERESLNGTAHRLSEFPRLERYIASSFESELDLGLFRVLRRRSKR